jgi:CHASE2 domain-containing sensor protein
VEKKLWARDWFAAVLFSLVFVGLAVTVFSGSMQGLERAAYDLGIRGNARTPSDRIAIVAIDDQSVANLGRWPWPRDLHARLIDKLREGGAKAVGLNIFYSEASSDAGALAVNRLIEQFDRSPLVTQIPGEIESLESQLKRGAVLSGRYGQDLEAFRTQLKEARGGKSADQVLIDSIKQSGNVILPIGFQSFGGQRDQEEPKALPDYLAQSVLTHVVDRVGASASGDGPVKVSGPLLPVPEIGSAAAGLGHLVQLYDPVDGYIRDEALAVETGGETYYPSMTLRLAAAALDLTPDEISLRLGEGVSLGGLDLGTDGQQIFRSHFYRDEPGRPAFAVDSFYDVVEGKIRPQKYKDKIVVVGISALGLSERFSTPIGAGMAPATLMANIVSSILLEDFYTRPEWAAWLRLGLCLVVTLYLATALPRVSPLIGALISAALLAGLVVGEFMLMTTKQLSLPLSMPALLLVAGHGFMMLKRLRLTERLKVSSETESAESNRMLGLAFQTQGQLDMAFDKFKRVQPVDDKVLDALYNLGMDFERKRQFNKAESVYAYLVENQPDYRDAAQKQARAKKLSETIMLGGSAGSAQSSLLLSAEAGGEKAKLGRYEIEKELGKGAMGVVYLGKDPRIGRQVAIKTMALSNEFEADELKSVKERFFREAESAGRLQHPNIVAIYDAGEEHDLAYIAMELLKGNDLTRFAKPESLLPVHLVVKFIAQAADALDYAHANGVVHRDVKPANMMLLPDKGIIKLTDFGIARISDASRTRTGLVLGSPSYMSPEQLRGQKVDGRSDLFSLGVTLFQLVTGQLPFQAESLATLMMKIVTEKHPDASTLRQGVPPALLAVIDKALTKDREQRYQRGSEMARALRTPPKPAAVAAPAAA